VYAPALKKLFRICGIFVEGQFLSEPQGEDIALLVRLVVTECFQHIQGI